MEHPAGHPAGHLDICNLFKGNVAEFPQPTQGLYLILLIGGPGSYWAPVLAHPAQALTFLESSKDKLCNDLTLENAAGVPATPALSPLETPNGLVAWSGGTFEMANRW